MYKQLVRFSPLSYRQFRLNQQCILLIKLIVGEISLRFCTNDRFTYIKNLSLCVYNIRIDVKECAKELLYRVLSTLRFIQCAGVLCSGSFISETLKISLT